MTWGVTWQSDTQAMFRLWAPGASRVALKLHDATMVATAKADGWYEVSAPCQSGDRYQWLVDDEPLPDPASRWQPEGVHGASVITRNEYVWRDTAWRGRPWEEAVIYELHVGSFSPRGDYAGVQAKLEYLKNLGVTAIELMPLASFDGAHGWGYDGVYPYAPHAAYGTPDQLRALVDAAHALGLMVILDVVYNHFGPSGNYLSQYAASFFTEKFNTPWGAAIDFTQPPVRAFFIENAFYWLNEFHFDGLRFDAVHAIIDPSPQHILHELVERVRNTITHRHIHLILENDKNEAQHLGDEKYNAQWNDDAHHIFHVLATGEANGYYADYAEKTLARLGRCLTQGYDYQGQPSPHRAGEKRGTPSAHLPLSAFVNFLQNHDQIGNRALGDRIAALADEKHLSLLYALLLLSPPIPLLFMGEEWGSKNPFLYFCDFEGALAQAVRDGRRKEFASFPEFADPQKREAIPDPNAKPTFARAQLDWASLKHSAHKRQFKQIQQLLVLRQQHIVPLLKAGIVARHYQLIGEHAIDLRYRTGDKKQLQLLLNLGDTACEMSRIAGETIWGETGSALPPLSYAITIGDSHG